jgi:hypothetical protein
MRKLGMRIVFWWKARRKETNQEDLDICARIILRWILEKQDGVVQTELVWLEIGTSGVLL